MLADRNGVPFYSTTGTSFRRTAGGGSEISKIFVDRIGLRTATPSTIFSRFGAVLLLFVSKLEKVTRWTEI